MRLSLLSVLLAGVATGVRALDPSLQLGQGNGLATTGQTETQVSCGASAGKCALNLCCSSSGVCGSDDPSCGSGCQSSYGSCSKPKPPDCGKGSGTATHGRKIGYYEGWYVTIFAFEFEAH